uniref:Flavodoxin-like domain-containing protein n=1 Tax=Panagrolaimus sp. PS1159 TaxID=55785 RepID=A0AC35G6J4_9BILA
MQLNKDFLILYGSQTGQSESIADQIYSKCIDMGLDPKLCIMKDIDKEFFIEKEKFVIVVVSSTGDGDPPENAHKFFRKIHKKDLPADYLSSMEFALLGLGDSNYSTFQGSPRKLEKQFLALGAKQILPRGEADDQIGFVYIYDKL